MYLGGLVRWAFEWAQRLDPGNIEDEKAIKVKKGIHLKSFDS